MIKIERTKLWVVFLIFTSCICNAQVTLTYVGNMGTLLEGAEGSVLIDGLHQYYGPAYLNPTDKLINDLSSTRGDLPVPSILLFTHFHKDHFSAELATGLNSVLLGPAQVTDQFADSSTVQVHQVHSQNYEYHSLEFSKIKIEAVPLDHTYKARHASVQNLGYLIDLGGLTILHVGDTDWFEPVFDELDLKLKNIDVVIIPFWMTMDQTHKVLLEKYINPKQVVVCHIDPRVSTKDLKSWQSNFPEAIFLTELNQQYIFD